jgi:hypothetical protein
MESSPHSEMSSRDQIGKVFVVRTHGLRECLICGEFFTRTMARAHADVTCYPDMDFLST